MAATTTQLAQALALKKKNPNISIRDAVLQTKQATTNPPAPLPVQPTGGATMAPPPLQVSQPAPVQAPPPIANAGDTVLGVNGEKFVQANNQDMTTTPVAPPKVVDQMNQVVTPPATPVTPVTPPKTETPTPTTPTVDFNSSQGREADIQKNISDITASNPALLKDRNAFNQAFGYETADPGKKAMLDSAFKGNQPVAQTADQLFSTIYSKLPVSNEIKNTPQYQVAQNRYARASSYSTMTPSQVSYAMNSGKLIEGSQTYEDLKTLNPKIVQDAENLRIANGQSTNIFTKAPDGTKINNLENTFIEDYLGDFGTFLKGLFKVKTPEEIEAVIYTPEVKESQDKAFEYEGKIDELDTLIENSDKQILESQKGTGATAVQIRLLQQSARDKLNNERNVLVKDYTRYANKANNLITQNTATYQESMKQQTEQNQALAGAAGQVFSSKLAQQNAQFQANLGLQTSQAQFEQNLAQQAQMASDPVTATNQVIDTFEKMGIMADRSRAEIIADVQAKVASGMSVGQAVSELQQAFKNKPMYKAMVDAQMAQYAPKATESWTKLDDTTLYNQVTGETKKVSASIANGYPATFSGDTTSYIASKEGFRSEAYQDSGGVWTIGYGTTKINGKPVQPGQTITQADAQALLQEDIAKHSNWKNYIDENTLSPSQKTALASFEYNLGPGIWNKSAMNIINMIKSGDLEGAGAEMMKYNTVKGTPVKGLTNRRNEEAQLLMNTGTQDTAQYSDSAKKWGQNILSGDAKISDIPASEKGLRTQVSAYLADVGKTAQNTNVAQIQDTISIIDELKNSGGLSAVVGLKNPFTAWTPGTDAAGFKAKLEQLTASNFMTGIRSMKGLGSLSDAEGSKVSASVSSLANTSQSEEDFKKELERLREVLVNRLSSTEVETGLKFDKNGFAITPSNTPTSTTTGQYVEQSQPLVNDFLNFTYSK